MIIIYLQHITFKDANNPIYESEDYLTLRTQQHCSSWRDPYSPSNCQYPRTTIDQGLCSTLEHQNPRIYMCSRRFTSSIAKKHPCLGFAGGYPSRVVVGTVRPKEFSVNHLLLLAQCPLGMLLQCHVT